MKEFIIRVIDPEEIQWYEEEPETPELVRCKECLYKNNTGISNQWLPCMDTNYPDNFYCGRGERKGGDGEC